MGRVVGWRLENKRIGLCVKSVVVKGPSGKLAWEQPVIDTINRSFAGAIVVPWFARGSGVLVGLVEQYRPAVDVDSEPNRWIVQFPRGFSDEGETVEDTARREVAEEMAIIGRGIVDIGA